MYTPQHQEHDLPHRQPSFIGLPPISPGPAFGSAALGYPSPNDFGLSSPKSAGSGDNIVGAGDDQQRRRAASPPPPAPVQRQSPYPWINSNSADVAAAHSNHPNTPSHTRAASSSAASGSGAQAASSPSMNSYSTQATTPAYRPSQGHSMHVQGGAYAQQPEQQQHPAYQNSVQYSVNVNGQQQPVTSNAFQQQVNGNGFQQQQYPQQQPQQQQPFAQQSSQNAGQYAVNGNGFQQQPPQQQQPQQFALQQLSPQQQQQQQQQQQYQQQQYTAQQGSQYAVQNGQPSSSSNPQGSKPSSYQQLAASSAAPRGMPSPSLASNGTFILPPGWNAQESHLQQPLSSQRHRASPSISSIKQQQQQPNEAYEIDKETGAAISTRSVSPPTHSPTDVRQAQQGAPSSSRGEAQNGFAPPNPPFAPQPQAASPSTGQYSPNSFAPPNPPFAQQGQGAPLGRTATNTTQGSDQPESKRNSRVFSSIRNRLGGGGNDSVTGDGVSDASVRTDDQGRKNSSSFFGLRGNQQAASEGRASYDMAGNTERSYFHSPPEKKPFFTRPTGGIGFGRSGQEQTSRPATSESVGGGMSGIGGMSSPPVVGFGPSVPRKNRFSKLTGMLNRDQKPEGQLSQPQAMPFVQGPMGRPSLTGTRPLQGMQMGPPGGPAGDAQNDMYGRPRAASAASDIRPNIGDQGRTQTVQGLMSPPQMGPIAEEDRGRKVSASNLLSNIFGKRSESRTREQQQIPPQSSPGLGQPQGMMNRGQTPPPRPGQPGQFPSFLAHSMGMPGQPPVLPPQGQYAGLAQQVHQNQHQQQSQGQPQQTLGLSSARLGAYLQGAASPGVSPVTQSSGSPFTTQPPGPLSAEPRAGGPFQRAGTPQQSVQVPPQPKLQTQGPQSPVGIVSIATAVPIRQVERSPNSNSAAVGFSGQNSPQDSTRGRSESVVNQIDIAGPRRPMLDANGRIRSGSSATATSQQNNAPPQHPVHIASLQAPVRKPVNPPSSQDSTHLGPQDNSSIETENKSSIGHSSAGSPTTRRVSQGLSATQHNQNASQTTPSTSPAPSQEHQPGPPSAPPKSIDVGLSQGFRSDPNQAAVPSPSIYRPSAPPIAPPIQPAAQSSPARWAPVTRGPSDLQNSSGPPAQPSQYPPQDMMMTAPPQEQNPDKEGAFAKLLKTSKTFVQDKTFSEKSKGEKESMGSKLLGAFKKAKQAEIKSTPPPTPPSGPPGGPAWGAEPPFQTAQRPAPPTQTQSAPLPLPAQHVVTEGLQTMPSKAQQLLGQPLNAMYQGPPTEPPLRATRRPSTERAKTQPYLDYQEERQAPGKAMPPLSPDHIGAPAVAAAPVPQNVQSPRGPPSVSSLSSQGVQGVRSPQQQQQQPPSQPRQSYESTMASNAAANNRAKNLGRQIVSNDQQYAPVAIPQAYAPVYAGLAAAALGVGTPAYAQPYAGMLYQAQPQQQWVHPSMMQGMVPGQMPPAGIPHHMVQQGVYQQYAPYQGTPPPLMNAMYAPPQQYIQHATPPPGQGQMVPPGGPIQYQMQQQQAMQQIAQQPSQQSLQQPQQPSSQQSWQANMTPTPPPAQHFQTVPPAPPQQAESTHSSQSTPVPAQHPPPTAALPAVPQPRQSFTPAPDVITASPTGAQYEIHQPSPLKPQPTSVANDNVPRSAFAVHPEQSQLQPTTGQLLPQRQISGASEVSSMTTEPSATNKDSPTIQRAVVQTPISVQSIQQPLAGPQYERTPITLTDEPVVRSKVDTPLASPAAADKDDLYGATPRHSAVIAQERHPVQEEHVVVAGTDESASKFAGMPAGALMETKPESPQQHFVVDSAPVTEPQQHFVVDSAPVTKLPQQQSPQQHFTITSPAPPTTPPSATPSSTLLVRSKSPLGTTDEEPPSPTESELKLPFENASTKNADDETTNMKGKPVQSSQEIFDEHKRKQLVRDMEEKIAIMPDVEMLEPPKRREDVPMMSATSYPGQEWNPYGEGFEEDDE